MMHLRPLMVRDYKKASSNVLPKTRLISGFIISTLLIFVLNTHVMIHLNLEAIIFYGKGILKTNMTSHSIIFTSAMEDRAQYLDSISVRNVMLGMTLFRNRHRMK